MQQMVLVLVLLLLHARTHGAAACRYYMSWCMPPFATGRRIWSLVCVWCSIVCKFQQCMQQGRPGRKAYDILAFRQFSALSSLIIGRCVCAPACSGIEQQHGTSKHGHAMRSGKGHQWTMHGHMGRRKTSEGALLRRTFRLSYKLYFSQQYFSFIINQQSANRLEEWMEWWVVR